MAETDLITDLGEAFSMEMLDKSHAEVLQGFTTVKIRNFRGKEVFDVKIKFPTVEVDSEASKHYSKVMSELLTSADNVITKAEMEEILKTRGVWGQKQIDEMEAIDDRLTNLMREGQEMHARKAVKKDRLDKLKEEYLILKRKKNDMIIKRENFMSSTVEGMAEVASLEYKLSACCEDLEGNKLWASFDEFKKEHNRIAIVDLLQKAMVFWSGLPQGVLSMLPEELVFGEQPSEQSQEAQSGD